MQQSSRQCPGFSSDSFVSRSPKLIRYPHLGTGGAGKHVAHGLGSPTRGVDYAALCITPSIIIKLAMRPDGRDGRRCSRDRRTSKSGPSSRAPGKQFFGRQRASRGSKPIASANCINSRTSRRANFSVGLALIGARVQPVALCWGEYSVGLFEGTVEPRQLKL
jgi:hypothetical protein